MIKLYFDNEYREHKRMIFSGGEVHVNIDNTHIAFQEDIRIDAVIKNSDDIMELLLLVDALRARVPDHYISCIMEYLPYARQDRRCADGDAFSLKVFNDVVLNYLHRHNIKIYVSDVHSRAGIDLINSNIAPFSVTHVTQHDIISWFDDEYLEFIRNAVVVAPDEGSKGKVQDLAWSQNLKEENIAFGGKIRDPKTGQLSGFTIDREDFGGKDIFIPDDICDGGGTFIGLASLLKERNCGKIVLYVTHGIFSNGFENFSGVVDEIWTTTSRGAEPCKNKQVAPNVKLNVFKI